MLSNLVELLDELIGLLLRHVALVFLLGFLGCSGLIGYVILSALARAS